MWLIGFRFGQEFAEFVTGDGDGLLAFFHSPLRHKVVLLFADKQTDSLAVGIGLEQVVNRSAITSSVCSQTRVQTCPF